MPKKYLHFIFALLFMVEVSAQTWEIQEGYEIAFSGKKAEGTFKGLEGTIIFDPNDLSNAQFNVSVDVNTIQTGNKTKNKHARSENWFFVAQFPKVHFNSVLVTKTATNAYQLRGELELKGIRKEVVFPFTFTDQGTLAVFQGSLKVNRKDFGIEGNFMEFLVGDEFEVKIRVPVAIKGI